MTGLRMSAMNVGPLSLDANLLVPFAPGHLEVPTTAAVMVRPSHGVVLWDTGINDVVADPNLTRRLLGRKRRRRLCSASIHA